MCFAQVVSSLVRSYLGIPVRGYDPLRVECNPLATEGIQRLLEIKDTPRPRVLQWGYA